MQSEFDYLDGAREVRATIVDWGSSKDEREPRLSVTYETDHFNAGSVTAELVQFECNIFETIKHGGDTAIICPAILPVLKRWQAFVRLYKNFDRSRKENEEIGRLKRTKHTNGCVAKNILRRESSPIEFRYAAIWKRLAINFACPIASFQSNLLT